MLLERIRGRDEGTDELQLLGRSDGELLRKFRLDDTTCLVLEVWEWT